MNAMANEVPLVTSEREVVERLKCKPFRVKVTATQDGDESRPRCWTVLYYDFTGKLSTLGRFLDGIAKDVFQAGGVVTKVEIPSLRTANENLDDLDPHGKWREMHVQVSIKTRVETEATRKAWAEAVKEIFRKGNR